MYPSTRDTSAAAACIFHVVPRYKDPREQSYTSYISIDTPKGVRPFYVPYTYIPIPEDRWAGPCGITRRDRARLAAERLETRQQVNEVLKEATDVVGATATAHDKAVTRCNAARMAHKAAVVKQDRLHKKYLALSIADAPDLTKIRDAGATLGEQAERANAAFAKYEEAVTKRTEAKKEMDEAPVLLEKVKVWHTKWTS